MTGRTELLTLDEFAARLHNPKPFTSKGHYPGYRSPCPAHDDKTPSFAVIEKEGWLKVHCSTGCTEEAILRAMGLTEDDRRVVPLKAVARPSSPTGQAKDTHYVYTDQFGADVLRKVRFVRDGKKAFYQERWDSASGSWIKGLGDLNGSADIPYRLPELIEGVKAGKTVYINEGEKACDLLRSKGLVATCAKDGAGPRKWKPSHTAWFRGATVVIVADRDEVGESYAKEVAVAVSTVARSVLVVQSKTEGEHDDAYDHFTAGFSPAEFVSRADLEPYSPPTVQWVSASQVDPKPVDWLVRPYIARGMFTLLQGDPGEGKSYLSLALSSMVSNGCGPEWFGPREPRDVLFLSSEDSMEYTIVPRLKLLEANLARIHCPLGLVTSDPDNPSPRLMLDAEGLAALEAKIESTECDLIVIDPIIAFLDSKVDIHRQNETRAALSQVVGLAQRYNVALLGLIHMNKGSAKALYKAIGSIDFVALARTVLMAGHDPDDRDRKAIVQVKSNIGPFGSSIGYEITAPDGLLVWTGNSELTADRMCESPAIQRECAKRDDCRDWLETLLAYGPYQSTAVLEMGKEAGHTQATIYRAKTTLGVTTSSQPRANVNGRPPKWWALEGYDWVTHWAKVENYDPYLDS